MEPCGIYSPSGIIAAFTRASCTLLLAAIARSSKRSWRGLTQAPHNPVKIIQTKITKEKAPQYIVLGRSVKGREVENKEKKTSSVD